MEVRKAGVVACWEDDMATDAAQEDRFAASVELDGEQLRRQAAVAQIGIAQRRGSCAGNVYNKT